jgi:hypothetical protein
MPRRIRLSRRGGVVKRRGRIELARIAKLAASALTSVTYPLPAWAAV